MILIARPIETAAREDGTQVALDWREIDGQHPNPEVRKYRPGRWATLPDGTPIVCPDPKPEPRGTVVSSCPPARNSR